MSTYIPNFVTLASSLFFLALPLGLSGLLFAYGGF